MKDTKAKTNIVIDEITTDEVISADFDLKRSEETITSFKQFIEDNRDELIALQILYNQQMGKQRLTYAGIRELVTDRPPPSGPC
nr:type I restriction-modification enzyme R subunit C-terminal domain-containing protein [Alteripontixanthobacter muriae]